MAMNFDAALGIHAAALTVRTQRAELLATNMANADTPNFKAQDIDFRAALNQAVSQTQSAGLTQTNQRHLQTQEANLMAPLQYRVALQDSLDGNTVDDQVEQAQFMQNAVQYQASLEFLGGKFSNLTRALKGE